MQATVMQTRAMLLVLHHSVIDPSAKYSIDRLRQLASCSVVQRRWYSVCVAGIVQEECTYIHPV